MTILDDIEALAEHMHRQGIASLSLRRDGESLTLRLAPPADPHAPPQPVPPEPAAPPAAVPIRSPEMGIFRTADLPADLHVAAGSIIGFVELGLARLPVTAPAAGRLQAAAIQDGAIVGYHDVLFTLTVD